MHKWDEATIDCNTFKMGKDRVPMVGVRLHSIEILPRWGRHACHSWGDTAFHCNTSTMGKGMIATVIIRSICRVELNWNRIPILGTLQRNYSGFAAANIEKKWCA